MPRLSWQVDGALMGAVLIAVIGIAQFACCVPSAMRAYPGGTLHREWTKGYSWNDNWLSDLGRTVAWNGADNHRSAHLFNRSIILMGGSLAVFFLASLRATEAGSLANSASSVSGFISSFGLVGIGFTPFDQHHGAHLFSLFVWIVPMLVVAIFFAIESSKSDPRFGKLMVFSGLALAGLVGAYAALSHTRWVVVLQKAVVIASIAWLLLLVMRVALTAIWIVTGSERIQQINSQAVDYTSQLEQGGAVRYRRYD